MGARNIEQMKDNLGSVGWQLTDADIARLDSVSAPRVPYPYSHQRHFPELVRPFQKDENTARRTVRTSAD
jgi:diketogulonate reductase-like aldo/keto reductase